MTNKTFLAIIIYNFYEKVCILRKISNMAIALLHAMTILL